MPPCTAAETDLEARRHNCFGIRSWPSGRKYIGEWLEDRPHGRGTFLFHDGTRYVGEWRDTTYHGMGILYRANKSVETSGRWENGRLVQEIALDTNQFPFDPSRPPLSTLPLSQSPTSPRQPLSSVAASVDPKTCSRSQNFYPRHSKLLNETGTVVLRFFVEADGTLGNVEVTRSSGFDRLDTAAIQLLETCTFRPAIVRGKSARSASTLEVVWALD